jgi:acid phosphatase
MMMKKTFSKYGVLSAVLSLIAIFILFSQPTTRASLALSGTLLADDFSGAAIDSTKWISNSLFSGYVDTSVGISQTNQQLVIGPLPQGAAAGGSHYRGIYSVNTYNFTGAYAQVELVQPPSAGTSADMMMTAGRDSGNYYRINVEAGNLVLQSRVGGAKTTLRTLPYNASNHRFIRIRHDASAGNVIFEAAPGSAGTPGTWGQLYSEAWNAANIPLVGMLFELKAGTWTTEANAPGRVIFDNFLVAVPDSGPAPAPTVGSITPNSGSTAGGNAVTIRGSGFANGATVMMGGVPATDVSVASSTTINATTPPHAAGAVNVSVTNSDGQSGTLANGFTYQVPVGQVPRFGHVFLIVEENHSYESVIGSAAMPYLNSLARQYGLATTYYANTHPSIGNYFMLTTGYAITNDDAFAGTVSADNLVRQVVAAGKTWKSYAESLPSVGWTGGDVYPYARRHNPFAYLTDVLNSPAQANNLVPFSQFAGDLASNRLPSFSYLLPNQLHNGHDCPSGETCPDADRLSATDGWLSANIAPLLQSALFQQDGLLIIVWDESVDTDWAYGGGHIATLIISPRAKPAYRSAAFYQHESALRTIAEAIGLTTFPGAAATAPSMSEFFDTSAFPTPNVASVSPNAGPTVGGNAVTISGSGFATGATVMVGGVPATNVVVSSGTTITATTPPHAAGAVNVVVTNTNGLSGTLANGYTYTVSAGETVLLADDFNSDSLDPTKWNANNLFSGYTDVNLPSSAVNQRFEVGPLPRSITGSHYNGLVSHQRYDFTNAYAYISVVQAPAVNTTGDAMLTVGTDSSNYYRIYEEAGVLYAQKRLSGGKVTLWGATYDAAAHRYWRIRHDAALGSAVFETAPDNSGTPGVWAERYREPWSSGVTLTDTLFEIKGGTWQAEANAPGKVIFDNFKLARP